MRVANKAISRERHPTPTLEDLVHTLNGATLFRSLIYVLGIIRYTTTYHKGLRRYKQLNFGINAASEIFQHIIQEQIHDNYIYLVHSTSSAMM